jgi:hypothetical protein
MPGERKKDDDREGRRSEDRNDDRRSRRESREDGGRRRGPRVVTRKRYEKPDEAIEAVIHRYGSRDKAIEALLGENYQLREDRRELEDEVEDLEDRVPAKDAIVLTDEKDRKKWESVKKIELEGDKIAERVAKAKELEDKDAKTELSKKRKEAAGNAGFNGDVLDPLLEQFGLEVELRPLTVVENGKSETKQVAHVRKAGDKDAAWEKLSDFVSKDGSALKPFEVALKATSNKDGAGGTSGSSGSSGTSGSTGGSGSGSSSSGTVAFPEQRAGTGGDGSSSALDSILNRNKDLASRTNPLSTRPAADTGKAKAS